MLKSDLNLARIKNEEYVIELAEIVHQYQEVSERNRMLEKISKQSRTIEDEFYSLKSQKYFIITLVIIWKIFLLLRIILKRTVNYLNNQDSSTPEQYTVNIKFNMNKISKNNNLANYNFKKQVVATELEIQSNKEDDNQKVFSLKYFKQICNREKESNKLNQNYSANNNNNILITESSFVSDYNSEKFYEETFKTEENDLQITEKRDIIITKKEDQSSHINISKNNKSHRSSKGYTSHTNKSHNSNNSAVSEYESFFDSKFKNDEYDSNAYQCLKNIENNNSNNTMTNENPNNNVKDEKGRRRRYDYNSDVFDTSK